MKDITKIRLVTDCEKFFTEFEDEIKLFRHRVVLDPEGAPFNVTVDFREEENTVEASVECSVLSEKTYKITEKTEQFSNNISKIAKIKRIAKAAV